MPSLSRSEARLRALISVTSVQVDLDLDEGEDTFTSRTRIRFTCREPGASTFLDLDPVEVASLTLNGAALDPSAVADGRVPLTGLAAENTVEAVATMRYSRDGQGLHRAVDPADGERYVYGHLFLDAAPSVFACFDQPDLKAPYAVSVTAPPRWQVLGNGAATQVGPGRWELAETKPLATYFVTVCAGPFASVRTEHDGIPWACTREPPCASRSSGRRRRCSRSRGRASTTTTSCSASGTPSASTTRSSSPSSTPVPWRTRGA